MWNFFSKNKINNVNFEEVQKIININNNLNTVIINTLPTHTQEYVILNTTNALKEEQYLNEQLQNGNKNIKILVYGKHYNDNSVLKKCSDLKTLGFSDVNMYGGGVFEWLLLRDVYGDELFPLNVGPHSAVEILDYKP
jgi:hypothetical protein